MHKKNGPGTGDVPRPFVSELPAGIGLGGQAGPAEVPALRYELGRLHSLGPLQVLILSLRIADGFSQHLAYLSLGLWRLAGRSPLGRILGHHPS